MTPTPPAVERDFGSSTQHREDPLTLGILGGMGPLATAHFFASVVRCTPAASDQAHLPTLVWSDGRVPDRTAALLGTGPSPLPLLIRGVETLVASGADVIAVPCNTAHAFLLPLRQVTSAPIIDMVRTTVAAAVANHPGIEVLGVMCTAGTRLARLYDVAAQEVGLTSVHVPWDVQETRVDEAIRIVKRGGRMELAERLVADAATSLTAQGAQVCIAACTELPLVTSHAAELLPVVDSVDCLARAAVELCLAGPPLPSLTHGEAS